MNAMTPRDIVSALPVPLNPEKPTTAEVASFTSAKLDRLNWIIRDPDPRMTSTAKLAGVFLLQCVNSETLQCNPSYRTIADTLGFKSEKTAERAVEALETCGWVAIMRFNRNKSNRYVFLPNEARTKAIDEYHTVMAVKRADDRAILEQTKLSGRALLEQTSVSGPDQTKLSGKHLKGTPEVDSLYEGEELLRGSAVPLSPVNEYAVARGDDPHNPYERPNSEEEAITMLEALLQGSDPSPGVMRYFREKLMNGELTPAMSSSNARG